MSHYDPDSNPFEEATRPAPAAPGSPPTAQPTQPAAGEYAPPQYQPPPTQQAPTVGDNRPQFYEASSGDQGYANQPTPYNPQQQSPVYNSPHPGAAAYEDRPAYETAGAQQQAPAAAPAAGGQPADQPASTREFQTMKFWSLGFYQQFFDVDTVDVLKRMGNTLVPISPPDFLIFRRWHANQSNGIPVDTSVGASSDTAPPSVEKLPDLCGPFWVCTTLWMALAIVGNMMSKISHGRARANKVEGTSKDWKLDFTVASVACILIYSYCVGMSLVLWGIMKWKAVPVTLVDTLALYGYSMFIFLLAALLCSIPVGFVQWLVVIICGVWSTAYLLLNLWHIWKIKLKGIWFTGVVLLVAILHMAVTMSFKFYFLNYKLDWAEGEVGTPAPTDSSGQK